MQKRHRSLKIWFDCLRLFNILRLFQLLPMIKIHCSAIASAVKSLSKPWTYLPFPDSQQKSKGEQTKSVNRNLNREEQTFLKCAKNEPSAMLSFSPRSAKVHPSLTNCRRHWAAKDNGRPLPPTIFFMRLLNSVRTNGGSHYLSAIAWSTVHV